MRRPLLIGEQPGSRHNPALPLYPYPQHMTGRRLCEMMDLRPWRYMRVFERINLIDHATESWPAYQARTAAWNLEGGDELRDRLVVLIGVRVRAAFKLPKRAEIFNRVFIRGVLFMPVPHPSGRNLWYNDPANMRRARRAFRRLAREAEEIANNGDSAQEEDDYQGNDRRGRERKARRGEGRRQSQAA